MSALGGSGFTANGILGDCTLMRLPLMSATAERGPQRSEWIPRLNVGELEVAQIGSKSQTDP